MNSGTKVQGWWSADGSTAFVSVAYPDGDGSVLTLSLDDIAALRRELSDLLFAKKYEIGVTSNIEKATQ